MRLVERTWLVPFALVLVALLAPIGCSTQEELAMPAGEPRITRPGPLVIVGSVALQHEPRALALEDLDRDGVLDLLVGGEGFDVLRGDGTGGFERLHSSPYREVRAAEDFDCADFDGEGRRWLLACRAG